MVRGGITMVKTMLQELSDQAEQHRIKKILANISPDQYILKLDEEREKRREVEKALRLACEELADHLLVEETSEEQRVELVDYLVGEFREEGEGRRENRI